MSDLEVLCPFSQCYQPSSSSLDFTVRVRATTLGLRQTLGKSQMCRWNVVGESVILIVIVTMFFTRVFRTKIKTHHLFLTITYCFDFIALPNTARSIVIYHLMLTPIVPSPLVMFDVFLLCFCTWSTVKPPIVWLFYPKLA